MSAVKTKSADIVVPYHNSLHHLRPCIESIFRCTPDVFHLYLVDDNSDEYTKEQVREILSGFDPSKFTLLENTENLGYLRSVNRGITAGRSPYVVLLNSDTVVTPSWLSGLLRCFATDPKIAVVNPVSNWANWTRINPPDGFTTDEIAALVRRVAKDEIRDIYNASGFCFAARRSVFDDLGMFDEVYGTGYWEETDFCMKAISRGFRVVVDLGTFIYHYGWGSHGSVARNVMMEHNKSIFLSRWHELYQEVKSEWVRERPEKALENAVLHAARGRLPSTPVARGLRARLARALREYGFGPVAEAGAARVLNKVLGTSLESRPYHALARRLGVHKDDPVITTLNSGTGSWLKARYGSEECVLKSAREQHTVAQESPPRSSSEFRVTYILPPLGLCGGILEVMQIVNNLVRMGVKANVASYGPKDESFMQSLPRYFMPYHFSDRRAMLQEFPDCDLIVATWWETVFDALAIQQARPHTRLAYFVQDYEPEFYPPDSERARRAELSYSLIHPKIVKTKWLARRLERFPGHIEQIPLGLNHDIFYDRKDPARQQTIRVVSMARPTSPRRNFEGTLEILAKVKQRRPDITIAFYGTDLDATAFPFECESHGRLYQMEEVAALLNQSTILLDCSLFQGFGRPGIEAMGCGTASVLTRNGGITDYAKHMHNCLLADPLDVEDNADKVVRLVDDEVLRARIVAEGLRTARAYDCRKEAPNTLGLFYGIMRS